MKKILMVLTVLFLGLKPQITLAEEVRITYNKLQGIFYNQRIDGVLKSNTVTMFGMKDRIAYCIEPGVEIDENYYDIHTNWDTVNFSSDLKEYIEKVGYYGYEYPGHQNNYYYIAAQELIWKAVRPDIDVTWSTGKNITGDIIDISKEKKEILDLVNKSNLKPSFGDKSFKDKVGKTFVLEDKNKVLKDYNISTSKYHKIVKDGNKLIITLNNKKVDSETLFLTRKHYDDAPLLIYSKGDSQKLAALRISLEKETKITLSNEEVFEEVEVPNTSDYSMVGLFEIILVGVGLVLFKVC